MNKQKERIQKELAKMGIKNETELNNAIKQNGYVNIGLFAGDFKNAESEKVV